MPNLNVTDQQTADLVAFLEWVSNIDNHDWPPQDKEAGLSATQRRLTGGAGLTRGAAAFKESCMGCHSIGGAGGSIGPALDTVGTKYDAATIAKLIADPTSVNPNSKMPAQDSVTEDDRNALGEFLAKQQ
jgi:Cytochrome c.